MVVLDRASWHRSPSVKNYLENQGIGVLYLPSGSSAISPIETVWAIFKVRWRKYLASLVHEELVDADLETMVRHQLELFAMDFNCRNVYDRCYSQMHLVMQGARL